MKYYIISLIALLFSATPISSTQEDESSFDLKEEAKEFSLTIVKSYFTKDCDVVYDAMSDSLLRFSTEKPVLKKPLKVKLCDSHKEAVRDKSKTFQNYKDMYQINLYTPAELEQKFNQKLPDHYKTTETDFFFMGFELVQGKDRSEDFIWDDMFIFMVRKEKNGWIIKGISG
ncbi:hypothetical protein ACFSX9_15325 [Flavobacterium ardleyense]|uniref:DUF4829 domain-containing protein n=1 Tax=Flavobacterium ardleyense TaxID=2038737 RepID=A0ABW5ZCY2_9FLAO